MLTSSLASPLAGTAHDGASKEVDTRRRVGRGMACVSCCCIFDSCEHKWDSKLSILFSIVWSDELSSNSYGVGLQSEREPISSRGMEPHSRMFTFTAFNSSGAEAVKAAMVFRKCCFTSVRVGSDNGARPREMKISLDRSQMSCYGRVNPNKRIQITSLKTTTIGHIP